MFQQTLSLGGHRVDCPIMSFLKLWCRQETRTSVVKMGRMDGKLELEDGEEGWEVIGSRGGIASINSKQLW